MMKVTIQCIHCEVDARIQERIQEKLYKMGVIYSWITEGTLYFKMEENSKDKNKVVELLLTVPGPDVYAKGQEETFELAAKKAIEGIRHQLKKHKGKAFAHSNDTPQYMSRNRWPSEGN